MRTTQPRFNASINSTGWCPHLPSRKQRFPLALGFCRVIQSGDAPTLGVLPVEETQGSQVNLCMSDSPNLLAGPESGGLRVVQLAPLGRGGVYCLENRGEQVNTGSSH